MNILLAEAPDLTEKKWESSKLAQPPKVIAWREKEFERMGFVSYLASHLAQSNVDLRKMEKILEQGCEFDLALDIFFGGREPRTAL